MAKIQLKDVTKRYGKTEVVHGINLDIQPNEFIVLIGPSGCGKSTTLRMIAGLEEISDGEIIIGDRVVNGFPPRLRNIAMVFQNYALYPHMTVKENLAFGLKIAKHPQEEIDNRVNMAADILGLTPLLERTPAELSGGQRQRVAMGRSIVRKPDVFLFDEPLSNLDAKLRGQMRTEIKKLHHRVNNTIVYVTHDQIEAMTLADRIVIMKDGYIEQIGHPLEVFNNPTNTFVASFIGSPPMNRLKAVITRHDEQLFIQLKDDTKIPLPDIYKDKVTINQNVILGCRAEHISAKGYGMFDEGMPIFEIEREVVITEPLGARTLLFTELGGQELTAIMLNPRPVYEGEMLTFQIRLDKIHLFDAETTNNLRNNNG
ncbi:MAG: ABC transporter ATP-binding protein [Niabella sp.]